MRYGRSTAAIVRLGSTAASAARYAAAERGGGDLERWLRAQVSFVIGLRDEAAATGSRRELERQKTRPEYPIAATTTAETTANAGSPSGAAGGEALRPGVGRSHRLDHEEEGEPLAHRRDVPHERDPTHAVALHRDRSHDAVQ